MIVKEYLTTRSDGVELFRTYSDEGFRIRQKETGNIYDEAVDVEDSAFSYEETEVLIGNEEATSLDYISALESLGVEFNG